MTPVLWWKQYLCPTQPKHTLDLPERLSLDRNLCDWMFQG